MKRQGSVMYTKKNRVVSFMDAILSIEMTILVLGLKAPASPDVLSFWDLREGFFSYALAFFWLGSMWSTFNNVFAMVEKVDNSVIVSTLVMLFLCSFVPYVTSLSSEYFYSPLIQTIFSFQFLAVSFSTYWMYDCLLRANQGDEQLECYLDEIKKTMRQAILIAIIGIFPGLTWYAPIMLYSIIAAVLFAVLNRRKTDHHMAVLPSQSKEKAHLNSSVQRQTGEQVVDLSVEPFHGQSGIIQQRTSEVLQDLHTQSEDIAHSVTRSSAASKSEKPDRDASRNLRNKSAHRQTVLHRNVSSRRVHLPSHS